MAGNQVTLTIGGDASTLAAASAQAERSMDQLESQMGQTGQAARSMASSVGSSEEAFEGLARESGVVGERLDRASGASSMLAGGLGDVGGALAEIGGEGSALAGVGEQLEKSGTIITGVTGALDLMILANTFAQASWVRTAASMVAARTAMIATSVGTGIATAAQWAWNVAMSANPIGLVIIAVAALVAGIIWVATKTTWFQTIWEYVWGAVVAYFNWVVGNYKTAIALIGKGADWIGDKLGAVPGLLKSAWSGLVNIITWPFRTGFNLIASAWNNTVGKLNWTVPGWVPIVGGKSISAPRLPQFAAGGIVPGRPGDQVLALLHGGEQIGARSTVGNRTVIELRSDGSRLMDLLIELLVEAIRNRGGIDVVFGRAA